MTLIKIHNVLFVQKDIHVEFSFIALVVGKESPTRVVTIRIMEKDLAETQ